MKKEIIKINIARKDWVGFICSFGFLGLIVEVIAFYSKRYGLGIAFLIFFLALCIITAMMTFLFCVKVYDDSIYVRTRGGKKYSFTWLEIDDIECTKRNSTKFGPLYYITLSAKSHELILEHTMLNFDKMAGLILEKYGNGEIKSAALSGKEKTMLQHFERRDIYPK